MDSEFWHERWENNQIGFHLNEVNKVLLKYWPVMQLEQGQRVFVPLCGKTLDIIWLLQQGVEVVGVELSEIALDELAADISDQLQLIIEKDKRGDKIFYQADKLTLISGDFFALSSQDIGPVDWIYDRAALVALPQEMRQQYSQHLRLISDHAPQFLVTLNYDQNEMAGPPFSVAEQEVVSLYQDNYQIALQESREIIDQEPKFKQRGVSSFKQDVYFLR